MAGTQTLYYTASGTSNGSLISFPIPDGLHEMGRKNLLAFDWALHNFQWDYMARINSSCYVSKRRLLDYAQNLPDKGVFRGVGAPGEHGVTFLWGGAQYLISRDVVESFVANGDKWNHRHMEDVSMSGLARDLGIALDTNGHACSINKRPNDWLCLSYGNGGMGGFEFNNFAEFAAKNTSHFIRVKQDLQREKDVEIMKELWKHGV